MRFISDKIKFNNYVKKLKWKNVSAKALKESMKMMKPINLNIIPDESYNEVKAIIAEMNQFKRNENDIMKEYGEIRSRNTSSRDIIESIKHSQYSKILFAIHVNKTYDMLIWKLL